MVAYSFNKIFVPQVENLSKRQTVRAHRKRHARPGESLQLYFGMRTRSCRKLVEPDPLCTDVWEIRIEVGGRKAIPSEDWGPGSIEAIELQGCALDAGEIETFAAADGFDPLTLFGQPLPGKMFKPQVTARNLMGSWWHMTHGAGGWQGVVVCWRPRGMTVSP